MRIAEKIPHNSPLIEKDDMLAVMNCLSGKQIGSGESVKTFEKLFNQYIGFGHSVAVNSGTAAIFLSLKVAGIHKGDNVLIPSYACSALLDAIIFLEATPIICDISDYGFNINQKIIESELSKQCIKAVIVIHTFGRVVNLKKIKDDFPNILLIEDCCHSLGAYFDGSHTGYGDFSIYSFYATKILAGGEGGLIWSNNEDFIKAIRLLISPRKFIYETNFNFRMSDLTASLLISQLNKIDNIINKRRRIHDIYISALGRNSSYTLKLGEYDVSYRFVFIFNDKEESRSAEKFFIGNNITVSNLFSKNELLHNLQKKRKDNTSKYFNSENITMNCLSIPCYPALIESQLEIIFNALEFFSNQYLS